MAEESTLQSHVLHRMYIARSFLDEGEREVEDPLGFIRMRAILLVDVAAELMLRTSLPAIGVQISQKDNIPSLIQTLLKHKPDLTSVASPVERVRRIRDRIQHDGLVPDIEETRSAAAEVKAFARALVMTVFGISLEEVNPTALIGESPARNYLTEAIRAFTQENYGEACRQAALSFDSGTQAFSNRIAYRGRGSDEVAWALNALANGVAEAASSAQGGSPELQRFSYTLAERVVRAIERLQRAFLHNQQISTLLEFGLSPRELRRFRNIVPSIIPAADGKTAFITPEGWNPGKDAASFAIDFVSRALLVLEAWEKSEPTVIIRVEETESLLDLDALIRERKENQS